jgi:hypothetical protein
MQVRGVLALTFPVLLRLAQGPWPYTRMTLGPGDPPGPTVPSGRQGTTVSIASWCLSNFT